MKEKNKGEPVENESIRDSFQYNIKIIYLQERKKRSTL